MAIFSAVVLSIGNIVAMHFICTVHSLSQLHEWILTRARPLGLPERLRTTCAKIILQPHHDMRTACMHTRLWCH